MHGAGHDVGQEAGHVAAIHHVDDPALEVADAVFEDRAAGFAAVPGNTGQLVDLATNLEVTEITGDVAIALVAENHLGLETLETRNSDGLDFHDLSVASIKSALEAAYECGRAAGKQEAR